jgi:hypothetical protein
MLLPNRDIGPWARDLIDECFVSRETRSEMYKEYLSYYWTGTREGTRALYNKVFAHIDRLASLLYSPVDARFQIEFDMEMDAAFLEMASGSSRFLNREFHRCGIDLEFAQAVNFGLVKGACLLKQVWSEEGIQPWVIHPESFGVMNEAITDLNYQEAFVHRTYLTKNQFARLIVNNPDQEQIIREIEASKAGEKRPEELGDDFFHQIIVGGINPVNTQSTASTGFGSVGISGIPIPMLNAKIAGELIAMDELWVVDNDIEDYTTIRMVKDIVVEGKYRKQNLSRVKGEHPFTKVAPNEVDGYFWGYSEVEQIKQLQELLNDQVNTINRLTKLKSDPPRAFIGFSGITQEKYRALRRPGGFLAEDTPNAKIETLAPDIPKELFERIESTIRYFDDVAGFTPIMLGQGETGVRSQAQASTLARNSSPRMRDRALLTERQLAEAGDFSFKLLAAMEAKAFHSGADKKKVEFMLSQLPDDYRVTVDSHTASPVFSEDAERKAFMLAKAGAIGPEELIMLTHPPREDTLIQRLRERQAQQAAMLQQHPELLLKGKPGPKR